MTCAETFLYDPLVDWTNKKGTGGAGGGEAEHENPAVSGWEAVAEYAHSCS